MTIFFQAPLVYHIFPHFQCYEYLLIWHQTQIISSSNPFTQAEQGPPLLSHHFTLPLHCPIQWGGQDGVPLPYGYALPMSDSSSRLELLKNRMWVISSSLYPQGITMFDMSLETLKYLLTWTDIKLHHRPDGF